MLESKNESNKKRIEDCGQFFDLTVHELAQD
jgi:hypothetical protein